MKKMTKDEAINFLQNKKVYVNGKSKEIQEKLFQLGWKWISGTQVQFESTPFLYIHNNISQGRFINRGTDMLQFVRDEFSEISAEDILSIVILEEYNPDTFDKVLVRDLDDQPWRPDIFLYKYSEGDYPFVCAQNKWRQCIPYKDNEHLSNKI